MKYRRLGKTSLLVSEIGFGAWAIGGPVMAGDLPIGWGKTDDDISCKALMCAYEKGINFYDTANFYGLGHSEKLLGKVFGKNKDIIIASKVGHRLLKSGEIILDYTKKHIIDECNKSLKRLKRGEIDLFQMHSAKIDHLQNGDCIEAMELLKKEGKIRYWGISLNTFNPFPEANFLMNIDMCSSFQVVFNILNQRSLPIIEEAIQKKIGIIARMPLQFGLLTGKFNLDTTFEKDDHRRNRLSKDVLKLFSPKLKYIFKFAEKYSVTKTAFALNYVLCTDGISTAIPGIRTPYQAEENTNKFFSIETKDMNELKEYYKEKIEKIIDILMKKG